MSDNLSGLEKLYKYRFLFLTYFTKDGAEATVRLHCDENNQNLEIKISFFSSLLMDLPEQLARERNKSIIEALKDRGGEVSLRTIWVKFWGNRGIEYQVRATPRYGDSLFFQGYHEIPADDAGLIENQIKRALE